MNKRRRERLEKAAHLLKEGKVIIDSVIDEEQSSIDNVPENLWGSEAYIKMEYALDALCDASTQIDEAVGCVETGMQ